MGSYVSCHCRSDAGGGGCSPQGKVVLSDGAVYTFGHQLAAAELMLEHPRHYVVEYRPSGGKLHPLPADHKLDVGRVYVMVPKAAPISAEEARRMVSSSSSRPDAKGRTLLPLFGMCLDLKNNNNGIHGETSSSSSSAAATSKEEVGVVEWSVEAPAVGDRLEILSRQYSSKGWKPSLGTIQERTLERKVSHWMF